jgi:exodeoxyribonuclease VII large subunit
MNKELSLAIVPQRVAIISSETAAGYGDFINQLKNNSFGYVFYTKLFQATLQGVSAEVSIISAFDAIFEHSPFFDAVVLIRGGGSKEELSVFDSYLIASNIAQYPIPVLTGIGHDRDESIADLVAYKKLKTPTAVAEFLIERVSVFDARMQNTFVKINSNLENVFSIQKSNLQSFTNILQPLIKNFIFLKKNTLSQAENDVKEFMNQTFTTQKIHLQNSENKLTSASRTLIFKKNNYLLKMSSILKNSYKLRLVYEQNRMNQISKIFTKDLHFYLKQEHLRLENDSKWLNNLSPEKILQRGYAIVYKGNTILKSVEEAKKGNVLEIKLKDGKILSEVK